MGVADLNRFKCKFLFSLLFMDVSMSASCYCNVRNWEAWNARTDGRAVSPNPVRRYC